MNNKEIIDKSVAIETFQMMCRSQLRTMETINVGSQTWAGILFGVIS